MSAVIIAEAGVNHNGSAELAFKLVEAAHDAGADIIKFQTFKAKSIVTSQALQADYQVANTGKRETQLSMLSRLELSHDLHFELLEYCKTLGIEFLSTAFDSESLNFLVHELGLKRLKIPSGEITNAPLLLEHAATGCELIVSTGMATLGEIEAALGVIAFGYIRQEDSKPSQEAFQAAYLSQYGQQELKEKVTLLHCTTEYPAPLRDINLSAMNTLGSAFNLPVGYSDHSDGVLVPIAAAARGAVVIEKHFTLDKNLEGPDHRASLDPDELQDMVRSVRAVESAIGSGCKGPVSSELNNKAAVRKSLVAARDISFGQPISSEDIAVKRPGIGQSPFEFWNVQSRPASKDYREGDLIFE